MIDENEAPEGYKAIPSKVQWCHCCAFDRKPECYRTPRTDTRRADGCTVIFIKRETNRD